MVHHHHEIQSSSSSVRPVPTYSGFRRVEFVDDAGRMYHFPTVREAPEIAFGHKRILVKIPISITRAYARTSPDHIEFPRPMDTIHLYRIEEDKNRRRRRKRLRSPLDTGVDQITIRIVTVLFAGRATGKLEYE